jgi:hypothetical protein
MGQREVDRGSGDTAVSDGGPKDLPGGVAPAPEAAEVSWVGRLGWEAVAENKLTRQGPQGGSATPQSFSDRFR